MTTTLIVDRLQPRDRLLLLAVSLLVLLPGVFGVSLVDRDEGWYAQVSREMLETGDWLVPRYLGEPWIGKPPLLYWCVAASFRLFGLHEWAGRLVSVIAMTLSVQLLAIPACELYGRRAALFASSSFITAGLPAILGKLLITDALLLLWILAACVDLWRIWTRGVTWTRAAAFWLCVGLGILTKGPAVLLFVGGLALALVLSKRARGLAAGAEPGRDGGAQTISLCDRSRRTIASATAGTEPGRHTFWLASPLCVLVAAPWYILVARHAGDTLVQQFFWYETASRLVSTPHGHGGPPGYYLLIGLVGWLPWSALLPGAIVEAWQARQPDPAARILLLWCGLPWLVLELIPSKLPHYVLPCFVPLAILVGRMWDRGLERAVTRAQRIALAIWVGVLHLLAAGVLGAAIVWRSSPAAIPLAVLGAVLIAGFALVARAARHGQLASVWRHAVVCSVALHVLAGTWLLPALEPLRLSRVVAERVNSVAPKASPMVCGYTEPSLFFYLRQHASVLSPAQTSALATRPGWGVYIVGGADAEAAALSASLSGSGRGEREAVSGFNYVKGRSEVVWIVNQPGPSSRTNVNTTAPATTQPASTSET